MQTENKHLNDFCDSEQFSHLILKSTCYKEKNLQQSI